MAFKVHTELYTYLEQHKDKKFFCQICGNELIYGKIFWEIEIEQENIRLDDNPYRWTCSEICCELLCLANGDINHPEVEYYEK